MGTEDRGLKIGNADRRPKTAVRPVLRPPSPVLGPSYADDISKSLLSFIVVWLQCRAEGQIRRLSLSGVLAAVRVRSRPRLGGG